MPHFEDLGSALRTARLRQELPQYELVERAGITKSMLSNYECGRQLPALQTLDKVLDALGIHLGTLYSLMKFEKRRRKNAGEEPGEQGRAVHVNRSAATSMVPADLFSAEVETAAEAALAAFSAFLDSVVERTEERLEAFKREKGREGPGGEVEESTEEGEAVLEDA